MAKPVNIAAALTTSRMFVAARINPNDEHPPMLAKVQYLMPYAQQPATANPLAARFCSITTYTTTSTIAGPNNPLNLNHSSSLQLQSTPMSTKL
jgi:hypothetical protein